MKAKEMNIEVKAIDHLKKIPKMHPDFEKIVRSLMVEFAEHMMHDLIDRYEEKIQSKVPELRKLVNNIEKEHIYNEGDGGLP